MNDKLTQYMRIVYPLQMPYRIAKTIEVTADYFKSCFWWIK